MRILVMLSQPDTFYQQPTSVIRQIMVATRDVINRQKEEGKIIDAYWEFEQKGPLIIYECNGPEELANYANEIPAIGLMDCKVKMLVDWNKVFDGMLECMEKGDDIMPGGAVK